MEYRGEAKREEAKKTGKVKQGEARLDLPCERLFLDLVQFLEGLFREKPLQSLGRGSEMPWDAGSLKHAVRRHGRWRVGGASTERKAKTHDNPKISMVSVVRPSVTTEAMMVGGQPHESRTSHTKRIILYIFTCSEIHKYLRK